MTAGVTVTINVVATGTPTPTYQWRKGSTVISGATSANYTIASPQTVDAGGYDVVVSNSVASVTSNAATLSVLPEQLSWTNWNNGQSIGSFFSVAGSSTETVAVGIDGTIATRSMTTGMWTIQTFTSDADFRSVIYAGGQFVAVREGGLNHDEPKRPNADEQNITDDQ